MLKKNKLQILLSSVIVLLPILFGLIFWKDLPDTITTHWGADGNADGFSGKAFAVFGLPIIFLGVHFLCLFLTLLDKKQKEQNTKALGMIFWIFPILSLIMNGMMYSVAFGREISMETLTPALIGVMFVYMGNYLPKVKQNSTLGIKLPWTLNNEENWNKTHRFGGKVWVVSGLAMLCGLFLPLSAMVWLMVIVITVSAFVPMVYSYCIYRQHKNEGITYIAPPKSKAEQIAVKVAAVVGTLVLIGVGILLFTGDIEIHCGDTSMQIDATYWVDSQVEYSKVDSVEYRTDFDAGIRANGFGSPRLSMGAFQNDEFGVYTLYAYTGAEEYIVLTSNGNVLVIGMRDAAETKALYETLVEKLGQ